MVMTPDDSINSAAININPILLENFRNVLLDVNPPFQLNPFRVTRQLLPVLSDRQIEEDGFLRRMLDQEGEARSQQPVFANVIRLQEWTHGDV